MTEEQKKFADCLNTLEVYKPEIHRATLEKMKEMLSWDIQEIDRRLIAAGWLEQQVPPLTLEQRERARKAIRARGQELARSMRLAGDKIVPRAFAKLIDDLDSEIFLGALRL